MTSRTSSGSKLITVASGKGGVGKTWLSTTLCHALSREGNNMLLFDGDLGLANVDIQLGLMPEVDLGQVLAGQVDLEHAITRFTDSSNSTVGFDVISGQSGSGALASIKTNRLEDLGSDIRSLSQQYDMTIMDLGAGVETSVMALSTISDQIIVVITADPTSLTDAYAFIKMNKLRNENANIAIVVNMAEDRHAGKRAYETLKKACENFLKFTPEYLGTIRRDENVVSAIRHQKPLLARHPQARAAEDLEQIIKNM